MDAENIGQADALRDRCFALPYKERQALMDEIKESLIRDKKQMRRSDRGRILLEYMEEIIGESIPVRCRDAKCVWARTMVAYQLLKEGFTTLDAGRMLGKQYTTIIHMRHKMQDALDVPWAYKDIIDIWKRFQNRLQDDIHN